MKRRDLVASALAPLAAQFAGGGKYAARFPKVALVTIDCNFGGWQRARAEHFDDAGLFDQIVSTRFSRTPGAKCRRGRQIHAT